MNFLVINADDMRADEVRYMPNVRRLIQAHGTEFSACRMNVALCSPSRAGFLSGTFSKQHGILTQGHNFSSAQHDTALPVWLNNVGYYNGLVGKFISPLQGQGVKPGWDFWRATVGNESTNAFGYEIFDGTTTTSPTPYQDHYFAAQGIDFLRGATEPWFLWFNPNSPHAPHTAPPNHLTRWAGVVWPIPEEADNSDKPSWMQALPPLSDGAKFSIQFTQQVRLQELAALDDAIGAMVMYLEATGALDDTIVVFTADNGMAIGDHRFDAPFGVKNFPYEVCLRVPLMVRGPGFAPGAVVDVPTCTQDVTAMLADLAGATPLNVLDGISLADIAADPAAHEDRRLLHYKHFESIVGFPDLPGMPSADFVTTKTRKLIRWQGVADPDQFEMYDLDADPNEHTNVAYVPARLAERDALEADLDALLA